MSKKFTLLYIWFREYLRKNKFTLGHNYSKMHFKQLNIPLTHSKVLQTVHLKIYAFVASFNYKSTVWRATISSY